MDSGEIKARRVLRLYDKLQRGELLRKAAEAEFLGVSKKAIQRDIETIRDYLESDHLERGIKYNRARDGYFLELVERNSLSREEVLALAKVLLDSRAFPRKEMDHLMDKLILQSGVDDHMWLQEFLISERFFYSPVKHNQVLSKRIWDLSLATRGKLLVEISYLKVGADSPEKRVLEPCGVIFSEYYFYLVAHIHGRDFEFPAVYRLDRIKNYKVLDQHYRVPYAQKFEEGEFRKRVQFMRPGQLMTIRLKFWGESVEAVLDRFPTARILSEKAGVAEIEAEVYGGGVKMWLLSQAQYIEVLQPLHLRDEMAKCVQEICKIYQG